MKNNPSENTLWESLFKKMVNESEIEKYKKTYELASTCYRNDRKQVLSILKKLAVDYKSIFDEFSKNGYIEEKLYDLQTRAKYELQDLFNSQSIVGEFVNVKTYGQKSFLKKQPEPTTAEIPSIFQTLAKSFLDLNQKQQERKKEILQYQYSYVVNLHNALYNYGLHPEIYQRETKKYFILIEYLLPQQANKIEVDIDIFLDKQTLKDKYVNLYSNFENKLLIKGKYIRIKDICRTVIISTPLKEDELSFYFESKSKIFTKDIESYYWFINNFPNESDTFLPTNPINIPLVEDLESAALKLKNLLINRPTDKKENFNQDYYKCREILSKHKEAWFRTPTFLRSYLKIVLEAFKQ